MEFNDSEEAIEFFKEVERLCSVFILLRSLRVISVDELLELSRKSDFFVLKQIRYKNNKRE